MNKTATVEQPEQHIYSKSDAARRLGGVSLATIDKHISRGSIKSTKIGRRVFIGHAELNRIAREGLPSLGNE
ncbi:MAG: hypothetical protein DMG37_01145 [Acidobacteria bacterium]|nr:MAG: hypothetical protein DMG37_01145 [Acidobacteriota bacterium]